MIQNSTEVAREQQTSLYDTDGDKKQNDQKTLPP